MNGLSFHWFLRHGSREQTMKKTILLAMVIGLLMGGCGTGFQVTKLSQNKYVINDSVNTVFFSGFASRNRELTIKASEVCPKGYEILSRHITPHWWSVDHYWIIECK